jgi:hypothetical protein
MKKSNFLRHQRQMASRNSKLCDVMPNQVAKEQFDELAVKILEALNFCTDLSNTEGVDMENEAVPAILKNFSCFSEEGARRLYNEWKTGNPFGTWGEVIEK